MNIKDIAGQIVKIGKTSITVENKSGKTCGIVTDITKFKDLRLNLQNDYFIKVKKAGLWNSGIDGIMDCVVFKNGELFYLNDTGPLQMYEECLYGLGLEHEDSHYKLRKQIAENAKSFATIIDCKVLS